MLKSDNEVGEKKILSPIQKNQLLKPSSKYKSGYIILKENKNAKSYVDLIFFFTDFLNNDG